MKKVLIIILSAVIISSCLCVLANALDFNQADGKTAVDFRMVVHQNYVIKAYYIDINIVKLDPQDREKIIGWGTITTTKPDYEKVVYLDPGFYRITRASSSGDTKQSYTGNTEVFEVKGNKMSVYCAIENEENKVEMPENTVVYGEDTQTWTQWRITEAPITDEPPEDTITTEIESTFETTQEETTEDLNQNEATTIEETIFIPDETTGVTKGVKKISSAQIGTYIFSGVFVLIIIGTCVAYFVIKKKRES